MDQFNLAEIARLQGIVLASIADEPTDIALKIGSLRAAADLIQNAVLIASLVVSIANAHGPKR